MHTKQVGDIAETAIILRALQRGWSVSKPVGENQRYDLIIDDGKVLRKVQCKSAKLKDKIIRAAISRISRDGDRFVRQNYMLSEIDAFAIYCPDLKECYLVDCKELTVSGDTVQGSINLRVEESTGKGQHKIRLAQDYMM